MSSKNRNSRIAGHFKFLLIAACAGVALGVPLAAQAQPGRLYFKTDGGGNVAMDTDVKEFFGPVPSGTTVQFDPGFRFGFNFGYEVTPWFAAELETAVIANRIRSITGASEVDDAFFSNVPLLVNARFQCPSWLVVSPYIGGGFGGSASVVTADRISLAGTTMEGSQSTAVFAYQAFAGLRFRLNENMGISLEYRYFATLGPEFEAEATFGTASDRLRFGCIETHNASIAFDFSF